MKTKIRESQLSSERATVAKKQLLIKILLAEKKQNEISSGNRNNK